MLVKPAPTKGHEAPPLPWLHGSVLDLYSQPVLEAAAAHLGPAPSATSWLLDVGCGDGSKTAAIPWGGRKVAVDIDRIVLTHGARREPSVMFVCADSTALPFRTGSIDATFSFGLLQLVDWRAVVREAARVLRPGGRLAFAGNLKRNPFVQPYRLLAAYCNYRYPDHQTPRQHLGWQDVADVSELIDVDSATPYHLLTPLASVAPLVLRRRGDPLRRGDLRFFRLLAAIDDRLLRTRAARLAWIVAIQGRAR